MLPKHALAVLSLGLLAAPALAQPGRPSPVSPGGRDRVTVADAACPTFNWAGVEGARGYELAVFAEPVAATGGGSEDSGVLRLRPILQQRIAGPALGWTPPAGRCLQRGATYGWVVRALGPDGIGEWSEPRLFRVRNLPSEAEVRDALEVLRGYLGQTDEDAGEPAQRAAPDARRQPQPLVPAKMTGLDTTHESSRYVVVGATGTGPPPPPPPPISGFTVDGTGSVFAPKVTADLFAGDGGSLSNVNASRLGGRLPSYYSDVTHTHDPFSVCFGCESKPTPGCDSVCEVPQPRGDGFEARCFGRVFDSGGPSADYGNNENSLLTICSPNLVQNYLSFSGDFSLEGNDRLFIIDGLGTPTNRCVGVPAAAPTLDTGQVLVGTFSVTSPGFAPSDSGCLSLLFCSDSSGTSSGWSAYIGCF